MNNHRYWVYSTISILFIQIDIAEPPHMENHMSYRITQCYLQPGRGDFFSLTQPKLVLDLATSQGCKAELTWVVVPTKSSESNQAVLWLGVESEPPTFCSCIIDSVIVLFLILNLDTMLRVIWYVRLTVIVLVDLSTLRPVVMYCFGVDTLANVCFIIGWLTEINGWLAS